MLSSAKPMEVVCSFDPAIDIDGPDAEKAFRKYQSGRRPEDLRIKKGATPSTYVLRALNDQQVAALMDSGGEAAMRLAAFQSSLLLAKDVTLRDGRKELSFVPALVATLGRIKAGDHSQLVTFEEQQLFPLAVKLELGEVAIQRAFFAGTGVEDGYVLPHTSVVLMTKIQTRAAERALRLAEENSGASKSPGAVTPGEPPGVEPGGAPATE